MSAKVVNGPLPVRQRDVFSLKVNDDGVNVMLIATALLLLFQTTEKTAEVAKMTVGGWIFMAGAWIFIISLTYYTFAKVLRGNKK